MLRFLYFCQNVGVSKPDVYSEGNMAKIVSDYNMSKERGIENEVAKPDIIMIMSESFWNHKILEDITYPDTFMDDYERIEQDGITANILSPQFGGGTCNVEFEALTGFSMDYIQNGLMPYFEDEFEQDIVRGWVISDNAVMNKIEEVYSEALERDESQFIFAVTIQNH